MIKQAMEYLLETAGVKVERINNRPYSTQPLYPVKEPTASEITVNSLSGLVDYIKSEFDGDHPLMIHVENPKNISCFTKVNDDYNRNVFIRAEAFVPHFAFERFHDAESFNISLQSAFVKNDDRDVMLKVVGNIREEAVNQIGDDGVSQSVVAQTGVATRANVAVPNPVMLQPFRTFVEVEQPESPFVFRMQNGPKCALFEADGGAWKLLAIENIKNYLTEKLADEIANKKVFIIA
ncbi:hypothetical protein U3450_003906 [Bacillus cytotoxicus]|uniref:hypothetical protein n=1 Tax=unclassified Bacillus cereus group TaxID=2750818 RepID=UPI001F56E07B|nr:MULTISPECIES: hypothetical protein [unclassified Bacillus cereus group]EMA6344850.1 hypothetical protein [Bacillus cytotoxicus]